MKGNDALSPSPFGNSAFSSIDTKTTEATVSTGYSKVGEFVPKVFASIDEPTTIPVKIASGILIIYALLFMMISIFITAVIIILNQLAVMHSGLFDLVLLKEIPNLVLAPITLIIIGLLFAYAGIKVKQQSMSGFWIAILVAISAPILTTFVVQYSLNSLVHQSQGMNPMLSAASSSLKIQNVSSLALVAAIIFIVISFKKFVNQPKDLSRSAKIFIGILVLIFLVPTVGLFGYGYTQALTTDYGFARAQKQVSYKLYRPGSVPVGLSYTSYFSTNNAFADTEDATKVTYGLPFKSLLGSTEPIKLAILRQTRVQAIFTVEDYIATNYINAIDLAKPVTLPNEMITKAYLIYITTDEVPRGILMMLTKDRTLIELISVNTTEQEVIAFAGLIR